MPALENHTAIEDGEGRRLLAKIAQADAASASVLVDRYYDDVYRFLRHLTRHVEESEDLSQQVLLRAIKGAARYDGSASVRTWIHRIAFREFLKWRRSRRIWLALDPKQSIRDTSFDKLLEQEQLLQALERLSPKLTATFLLVEVQELSHADAAIALDVPVGTIKSRLHEARVRLRQMLCPFQGEEKVYEN